MNNGDLNLQAWGLDPVLPVYRASCANCGIGWMMEGGRETVIRRLIEDGWQLRESKPWCVDCVQKSSLPQAREASDEV